MQFYYSTMSFVAYIAHLSPLRCIEVDLFQLKSQTSIVCIFKLKITILCIYFCDNKSKYSSQCEKVEMLILASPFFLRWIQRFGLRTDFAKAG